MSRPKLSLEELWRLRIGTLRPRQWQTDAWHDLVEALQLRDEGDLESMREWYRDTLRAFEQLVARCQQQEASPALITCESELAELFLRQGAEAWLDGLSWLAAMRPAAEVLRRAEEGQRLMVAVQMLNDSLMAR